MQTFFFCFLCFFYGERVFLQGFLFCSVFFPRPFRFLLQDVFVLKFSVFSWNQLCCHFLSFLNFGQHWELLGIFSKIVFPKQHPSSSFDSFVDTLTCSSWGTPRIPRMGRAHLPPNSKARLLCSWRVRERGGQRVCELRACFPAFFPKSPKIHFFHFFLRWKLSK